MTREMGESSLIGDMIRMPLPNNGYLIYPAKFAMDAIQNNKYSLFVTMGSTKNDPSILAATTRTGARTILMGDYDKLVEQLLDIPWEEEKVKTSEGIMYRKIAPSHESLLKYIELLQNTTR